MDAYIDNIYTSDSIPKEFVFELNDGSSMKANVEESNIKAAVALLKISIKCHVPSNVVIKNVFDKSEVIIRFRHYYQNNEVRISIKKGVYNRSKVSCVVHSVKSRYTVEEFLAQFP
jgi:hypothetical protein